MYIQYIQPLTPAPSPKQIAGVRDAPAALYGFDAVMLPAQRIPRRACCAPRDRCRAAVLLDGLRPRVRGETDRVLGPNAADISVTKGATCG